MSHRGSSRRLFLKQGAALGALWAAGPAAAAASPGPSRYLLADNAHLASARHLKRVLHRPQPHSDDPILTGTEPWERWLIGVNGRCVIYDQETAQFKMWYGAYSSEPSAPMGQGYRVCYAVSEDGLNWTRPVLGQVEWEGSRKNNLIRPGDHWMRRPNIIQDLGEKDPERRFKMTYVDVFEGRTAIANAFSRDGIVWNLNTNRRPWFTNSHSANLLGWDPRIREYVLYRRVSEFQQQVGRSTSADFDRWSEPEVVVSPGLLDLHKGFAGLAAFLYEDLYMGFLWVRYLPERLFDAELALSRDGIQWERLSPGDPFLPRGEPQSWDSEGVLPVAPVIFKDRIWIYYNGWNYPYGGASLGPVQEGWIENGRRKQSAIGLATLRLDGFLSVEAGREVGTLTTRPLKPAGRLLVNADLGGELRVEILDEKGAPLPGFEEAQCRPVRGDSLRHAVTWSGGADLRSIRSPIQLRFSWRQGNIYSFSFDGSSRGQ